MDLLAKFYPKDDYDQREQRRDRLRQQYDQMYGDGNSSRSSQESRGRGDKRLADAWKDMLRTVDRDGMQGLVDACEIADGHGVLVTELAAKASRHLKSRKKKAAKRRTRP